MGAVVESWIVLLQTRTNGSGTEVSDKARRFVPENHHCNFLFGYVYLKQKQYNKAESLLIESLRARESDSARNALAWAYIEQGKIQKAEKTHLDGIKLRPKKSEVYESYAAFLSYVGREVEADEMNQKAKDLQRVN